ncbi:AbrB/MazE/SpoVT family DNA-binding domain-containing protein [Eleftheria terrae]|uniref:AbrB/MazE/SpoVT family DNA-binding domain-containing protein n=1 Tax=Eleftheria terrae TaxID=1597781 RepID=UPI00263A9976|nr:AbrB/MazE/SpoVT family DNA-binding domain-containing protein [Eleftheria terrae]WKB51344.1 AbrB/MazE/SpoVT family DNA-binding domain-containing protein [Eleftheria terrae]
MTTLKRTHIGTAVAAILPQDAQARREQGGSADRSRSLDGRGASSRSAAFNAQMDAARQIMKRRHAVLRPLAR